MDEIKVLAEWTGWPAVVAFMLLGGGLAYWLLKNRIEHLKETNASLESGLAGNSSYSYERCAIRVVSPSFGERVPRSFRINGTFQYVPEGAAVWVCVVDGEGKSRNYWPQDGPAKLDKLNRTWHAKVNWLGGNPGDLHEVVVMVVGEDGQALIDYYLKVGAAGTWHGMNHLTRDMKECVSHKVIFSEEAAG
jgi:hypothetical protein